MSSKFSISLLLFAETGENSDDEQFPATAVIVYFERGRVELNDARMKYGAPRKHVKLVHFLTVTAAFTQRRRSGGVISGKFIEKSTACRI